MGPSVYCFEVNVGTISAGTGCWGGGRMCDEEDAGDEGDEVGDDGLVWGENVIQGF